VSAFAMPFFSAAACSKRVADASGAKAERYINFE
jgi:hypothetical protein